MCVRACLFPPDKTVDDEIIGGGHTSDDPAENEEGWVDRVLAEQEHVWARSSTTRQGWEEKK